MARVLKAVDIPASVNIKYDNNLITVKGKKGELTFILSPELEINLTDASVSFAPKVESKKGLALTGTTKSIINNMMYGVSEGFEKRLKLVGIGYRAKATKDSLNLSLGFSHPIDHKMPDGISVETPSQTEIIIRGIDKQKVGQVAADIRHYRPPEPYKGKGISYSDEVVVRKDAKKK